MSHRKSGKEVIVVGGGLVGLSAAMKLAEKGCHVKLISVTKVKRSHSVCAQGGINAAMNLKNEDDSPLIHAYDTIKGGDYPDKLELSLKEALFENRTFQQWALPQDHTFALASFQQLQQALLLKCEPGFVLLDDRQPWCRIKSHRADRPMCRAHHPWKVGSDNLFSHSCAPDRGSQESGI